MTETEASFNLTCFEDDFDKHIEEINEYYECKCLMIVATNICQTNAAIFVLDLETHDYIELNWKCPGRKTPQKAEDSQKAVETPTKEQ